MISRPPCVLCLLAGAALASPAAGDYLGTASSFAVLAGSTVTNTGPSSVIGNVGVWPGSAVTGFPPGIVANGSIHISDGVAQQAWMDASNAYDTFASMASNQSLTGFDLGGMTVTPGVYTFSSSAFLTGSLTLDAQGDPHAVFVFQIGSTLTTASASSVLGINGASGCNVFWQVGTSATLGTTTSFMGSILARASVTLNTGATIMEGRAIALDGAVTMDSNTISSECEVPGPGISIVLAAATAIAPRGRRRSIALAGTRTA